MSSVFVTFRRVSTAFRVVCGGMLLAATMTLQATPVAAAGTDRAADAARVLELTNAERQANGLAPLVFSAQLTAAAQDYSGVLAAGTCFEHDCGAVPNFVDRLREAGYTGFTTVAENIAAGYPTPEAVVTGWMGSPGHRANILSPDYTDLGVGVVSGGRYGTYWAEEFGSQPTASLSDQDSAE